MTHYEAILNHIKADAPCSLQHVISWANSQGFGGQKMTETIDDLKADGVICLSLDWDQDQPRVIVELN